MNTTLISVFLVIVGLINFVPIVGLLSRLGMEKAYDVRIASKDMEILMRHRALLFGILGGFVIYAAFYPAYHVAAMVMAGMSMVGFVVLVVLVGGYNSSIFKVLVVDLVGIAFLLAATVLKVVSQA